MPSTKSSTLSASWTSLLALSLASAACAEQGRGPVVPSSASQVSYAETYPEALETSKGQVVEAESEVTRVKEALGEYPSQLTGKDYALSAQVAEEASTSGRSAAYAAEARRATEIVLFLKEEKDKISSQVAGSVRYVLKEKGASDDAVDAGGSAAVAGMHKAIQKQLEERAQSVNEAHRTIAENEEKLGKAEAETLRKQANEIALAAYLAFVALPERKAELERIVGEAGEAKSTLADEKEEEEKVLASTSSDKRKALAKKRISKLEESLGKMDAQVSQAEEEKKSLDERIQKLQKDFEKALSDLVSELEERADKAPAKTS